MLHKENRRAGNSAAGEKSAGSVSVSVSDNSTTSRAVQVPISALGRVVGVVRGDVFRKAVAASRHFLRVPPAIALDLASLDDAERNGAVTVEVRDVESGATYSASIENIRARGFLLDRGHGAQLALPIHLWSVRRAGEAMQLRLLESTT